MYIKQKSCVIILLVIFIFFLLVPKVYGINPTMIEADESINGFNSLSEYGEIYARSPFRNDNEWDDFVLINSPFDEPRGYECHHGVDLNAWYGRPVYCVFTGFSSIVKEAGYYSGYGNKVVVQHNLGNNYAY